MTDNVDSSAVSQMPSETAAPNAIRYSNDTFATKLLLIK